MIIAAAIIWYIIGVLSHIYWLTAKYDYQTDDITTSLFSGLIGPVAFWVGWTVYGPVSNKPCRTLFRKRGGA